MESNTNYQPISESASIRHPESLTERIWKYKFHYVIVIPAFIFLFAFKIVPFLQGILLSLKDYKVFQGLFGSPFVGLAHYASLFRDAAFGRVLGNTVLYNVLYLGLTFVVGLALAVGLSSIASGKLRGAVTTALLAPYVLPTVVLGSIAMWLVSPTSSPFQLTESLWLAETWSFRLVLLTVELVKTAGIPAVIGLAAVASAHAARRAGGGAADSEAAAATDSPGFFRLNVWPATKAVLAVTLLQSAFLLTSNAELVYMFLNPLVNAETVDYFIFRNGFMNARFDLAAAAWYIQYALQLALAAAAYFLVRGKLLNALFHQAAEWSPLRGGNRAAGLAAGIVCSAAALLVLYLSLVHPFVARSESGYPLGELLPAGNLFLYAILFAAASIFHLAFVLTLSYPMTVKRLPGGTLYRLFLIAALLTGSGTIHEYLFYRNLEMVNTVLPVVFHGFFGIAAAFALKGWFNGKYADLKLQAEAEGRGELRAFFMLYIPKVWKPLLALGGLQWIMLWNSYMPSLIYISDPSQQAPMLHWLSVVRHAESLGIAAGDPVLFRAGALLSLPPLILFLLLRKWLPAALWTGSIRKP